MSIIRKNTLVFFLTFFLLGHALLAQECTSTNVSQFENKRIRIGKHVEHLSSFKLLGRSSLTGHDIVASLYIDSIFRSLNLKPFRTIPQPTFYQPFNIILTTPVERSMTFIGATYQYGSDFIFLGPDSDPKKSYEIVFGGYGYAQDIDSLDLQSKALLILADNLRVAGIQVGEIAKERGCSMLIVANPSNPKQFESISQQLQVQHNSTRFGIIQSNPSTPSRFFKILHNPIPQVLISDKLAARMLGESPLKLANSLEKGKSLKSIPSEMKVKFNLSYQVDTIKTHNVVSWIPSGIDSQQSVLVCAHFDHLSPEGKNWYPGADDNASGIAVLLELVRMFAKELEAGYKPLRNIVFAAFTAEEIGLFGSEYYSINPLFNIDSTALVLNFDMIGRMGKQNKSGRNLFISGSRKLDDFENIMNKLNQDTTLIIDTKNLESITLFSVSDHFHFMEKGVPAYLITTGLHNDYHKTTDTPEKLAYDNMVGIIEFMFKAIKHFAETPKPWGIINNQDIF